MRDGRDGRSQLRQRLGAAIRLLSAHPLRLVTHRYQVGNRRGPLVVHRRDGQFGRERSPVDGAGHDLECLLAPGFLRCRERYLAVLRQKVAERQAGQLARRRLEQAASRIIGVLDLLVRVQQQHCFGRGGESSGHHLGQVPALGLFRSHGQREAGHQRVGRANGRAEGQHGGLVGRNAIPCSEEPLPPRHPGHAGQDGEDGPRQAELVGHERDRQDVREPEQVRRHTHHRSQQRMKRRRQQNQQRRHQEPGPAPTGRDQFPREHAWPPGTPRSRLLNSVCATQCSHASGAAPAWALPSAASCRSGARGTGS